MRSRNIKPGFFKDEELAQIPIEDRFQARYLFAGLWCMADCEGRLEDRTGTIRGELFMHDEEVSRAKVHHLLQLLHDRGFVIRYEVHGKKYLQVRNFKKHQNPHINESKKGSEIPPPQQDDLVRYKHQTGTVQAPDSNGSKTEPVGMIPDSLNLIPDSLIPDSRIPETPVSVPARVVVLNPEPDDFPVFWGLFVAAGVPLNDRDKERTLRLWLNYGPDMQARIISWVIQQFKSGEWPDARHTPRPDNALKTEGWTRVASPRVIPRANDPATELARHMEQQRARGLR